MAASELCLSELTAAKWEIGPHRDGRYFSFVAKVRHFTVYAVLAPSGRRSVLILDEAEHDAGVIDAEPVVDAVYRAAHAACMN